MVKVELAIEEIGCKTTLEMENPPHNEKDLLKSPEYKKFYFSVGLGAPVTATVTEKSGILKRTSYSFHYTIKGNGISYEEFNAMLKAADALDKCDSLDLNGNIQTMIFLFQDYDSAYDFFKKFEGICNVGASHGKFPGGNLVKLEFHPLFDDKGPQPVESKPVVKRAVIFEDLLNLLKENGEAAGTPGDFPALFLYEDDIHAWNTDAVLLYMRKYGMLSSKEDYGFAEQTIAINCIYTGMYAIHLFKSRGELPFEYYKEVLNVGNSMSAEAKVQAEIDLTSESEKANLDHLFTLILPEAAKYSNQIGTADQIREVCCALLRLGMVLEYNR